MFGVLIWSRMQIFRKDYMYICSKTTSVVGTYKIALITVEIFTVVYPYIGYINTMIKIEYFDVFSNK